MADKSINDLPQAVSIASNDLFVLQQGNIAKKCTGALFLEMVEAHGGIASVSLGADYKLTFVFADGTSWTSEVSIRGPQGEQGEIGETGNGISSIAKTSTSELVDTYTITYTDGTTTTFTVTNGADGIGISNITKTSTEGLIDTYTITYTDSTTTTFTVTNGAKGDTGETGNGIASAVLNEDYTLTLTFTDGTSYTTPSIRGQQGETGETGTGASVSATDYATDSQGITPPSSGWQSSIPTVAAGNFLWQRLTWNNGTMTYIATMYGLNGAGSGDMEARVYDPEGTVALEGGIPEYVYDSVAVKYTKPASGIPDSDIANSSVWNGKANKPDLGTIDLSATWTGSASPYSQTVTVAGATVTSNSKVDIQPSSSVIAQLINDGCNALYIENNAGTLTCYAIGEKPTAALIGVQVSVTEVVA